MSFQPGDRVITRTGRTETILDSPSPMPHHELVEIDRYGKAWILRYLLVHLPSSPYSA
jgi:hypothetical protein